MHIRKLLRILTCTVLLFLSASIMSACSHTSSSSQGEKLKIVSTIFPSYDWVEQIVGEDNPNVEHVLIVDNGVDMHSYQPSVEDMANISSCDILITVGGISESWILEAIEGLGDNRPIVVNLVDILGDGAKVEETKEGMTHTHDQEGGSGANTDQHQHDEGVNDHGHANNPIDEHVWLSLRNAEIFCDELARVIAEVDPENTELYYGNAETYIEELRALDKGYETLVENSPYKTIVVADRFPFRYLVDDYGLDYYAAFPGCEAEAEASFETLIYLSQKIDELGLSTIVVTESADERISRTVAENTSEGIKNILTIDSMQSVTKSDISAGMHYIKVMKDNLEVLEQALS